MSLEFLSESNFLVYAAKHYDNPGCLSTQEFLEDVKRFRYVKKLITRYRTKGELRERIILNHLIILNNVFGNHLPRMILLKLHSELKYVIPFMIFLNIMPDTIYNVKMMNSTFHTDTIDLDINIINRLRAI